MTMTSNSMSFLLDEIVSDVAFEKFYSDAYMMPALYTMRASSRRRERSASFSGLRRFEVKLAGQAPSTDEMNEQFEKNFTHTAYAKLVPVERELIDDQEFGMIEELGTQIGAAGNFSIEVDASAIFRDAFAGATHTAEDALSICNAAHLNVDGLNSQSNSGSTALSMAAVKTTRSAMRNFTNYKGDLLSVRPDGLVVPPDIEEDAWEIVRSTGKPNTTNNAANFYNGMFQLYSWDFLSTGISDGDANNWFMIDSRLMKQNLIWYMRVPLEIYGTGDLETGTRKVGGYMRYSWGVKDWRWVYGHSVV
jgi:hypothetical protein